MKYLAALAIAMALLVSLSSPALAADPAEFLALSFTDSTGTTPYRLYVPPTYDPEKQYPLVLFLHGAGEKGTDNVRQINGNIDNLFNHVKMPQYESLLVAPQAAGWWGGAETDRANKIVELLQTQYNIHPDQVFCTGLSMGGGGTWEMASHHTSTYNVFVPICGTGTFTQYADRMVDYPIWAFHAADDTTVSVAYTRGMILAIREAGGNPLYTEYVSGGHGIWGRVYATEELYEWMYDFPVVEPYGPVLTWQSEDLGDGLYAFTFSIENANEEELLPYVAALGFEGVEGATIQQVLYNGSLSIHNETWADMVDGSGGYSKAADTWAYSPFGDYAVAGTNPLTGAPLNGFYEAANAFAMSCYSGPVGPGSGVQVVRVVADGNVEWTGNVEWDGDEFETAGVTDLELLPGYYNDDGQVSGADYVVWADTFGNDGSAGKEDLRADGNGDGLVSGADYVVWADNFGATAGN